MGDVKKVLKVGKGLIGENGLVGEKGVGVRKGLMGEKHIHG